MQLVSPLGTEPSPFGLLPKSKKLKVVGIFSSGMPEYDQLYVYVSLYTAQYYLGFDDEVNSVEVRTINSNQSRQYTRKIQTLLGEDFVVEDWSVFDANLFNAMKMEKIVMYLVLILMILIASFNMTGNFVKLVTEKKMEIGVLKAMGASQKDIVKIFIIAGIIIGFVGVLIAFLLAILLLWSQLRWQFVQIPIPGFPLQSLPIEMRLIDFILVPAIALIISSVSTILPASKTMKIDPLKIIRNQ
ncbi:MAG TPA: ABC transporter permease [Desulfobacterales bacterium]|nr:ABC transporter permease [Desulfobacterales bacterium]